jgi:hypothetical protein
MNRASVQKRLLAVQARLRRIRRARKFRRTRTLYWRARYHAARKGERKQWYLHKARISARLSQRITHTERVLIRRAENKIEWLRKHPPTLDPDGDDLILIDGKQVSEEVGKEVLRIRSAGRWGGYVVSGYRTPAYSQSLCYGMCGRPMCPGRCAGVNTNHARKGGRNGAVDLTDYLTFRSECWRLGSWLENHLPRDLVHFSDSGN